jgi:hypothetical protein
MTAERREQLRLAKQRQRQRAREAGLCTTCALRKPERGATCDECLGERVERRRRQGSD